MSSQPNKNKRTRISYSLLLFLLVLSVGWIISPAFTTSQSTATNGASQASQARGPAHQIALPGGSAAPQGVPAVPDTQAAGINKQGHVIVSWDVKHDVSPPLSSMKPLPPIINPRREHENQFTRNYGAQKPVKDPVLQDWFSPLVMPAPIANFDGLNGNQTGSIPPDTNGDVGPNHYVQWVNTSFEIFNKSGGVVQGATAGNTIWSGFGGPCQTTNDGDPIVLYDSMADRWVFSQLGNVFTSGPYYQCIAVSQTANPTGPYYRYAFVISNTQLNDYPKFGVWPDAYYMSANQFQGGFQGPAAVAFDRNRMLSGLSATMQKFDQTNSVLSNQYFGLLPSDLDGPTAPPANSPNYFVTWDGPFLNRLYMFRYHVDWVTPANSTMTGPTQLTTASFNQLCNSCMTQPGTSQTLDTLAQDTMYRLAYRNFGSYQALVTNHSVDAGTNHAGIRWYEIRSPNASPFIFQQGTYAPDGDNRWMGSIAMDHNGDMALGFTTASSSTFPSARYAGRLITDPAGQMSQGEATLQAGTGSQSGGFCSPNCNRWGDYSMMTSDPVDDCTFWYTSEYQQTTGSAWRTRIGSFKFPSCTNATATPTPTFTQSRTPTITPTITRTFTPTITPTITPNTNTGFAHFVPAGPTTIVVGGRLNLDLWVNAGGNNITAAQNYMTFTNSIVQLVNVSQPGCVLTSTVTADPCGVPGCSPGDPTGFDAVLQNETCNGPGNCTFRGVTIGPGSFAFASGALANLPQTGDFRVAQTAWCASAVGDAVLHWQFTPPAPLERDTEIVDENGNLVHNPNLYTDYVIHVVAPSPTPANAQLVGHVTIQGRPAQPNALQSVPVTLTLKLGATEVNYPSQNTDSSGFFTVTAPGPGTYNWRVKNPQTLANSGSVTIPAGGVTQQEMGLLREGDANNDNCTSALDFNILKGTFGKTVGDPGYDPRADFNGDNAVGINDFNLLKGTFGQCGASPISPAP